MSDNSLHTEYQMERESINSLQTKYLIAHEKACLDRDLHGDYTKEGLRHLVNAARIQLRLASLTTGSNAQEHIDMGGRIIREAHAHMLRLGLIESLPRQKKEEVPAQMDKKEEAPADVPQNTEADTNPYEELQGLIGLTAAKQTISSILNALDRNAERKKMNMPTRPIPLHMVFEGRAGTGKTTVARIVARIYKKMGLLSKGHLVEVSGSNLIAGFVGQTGGKTQEAIERARGGILFIDEAYSLSENKFGVSEAIPALLMGMENYRDDLAVIVAGYSGDMEKFIESNQGLASRFTHFVHFDDYTSEEMSSIFRSMCENMQMKLSEEAESCLGDVLKQKANEPDFGNARGVRNLFDQTDLAQANRLAGLRRDGKTITPELLTTFEREDILAAVENGRRRL